MLTFNEENPALDDAARALASQVRREILRVVANHKEGIYQTELAKELDIDNPSIIHKHTEILESACLLRSETDGRKRVYYPVVDSVRIDF